MKFYVTRDYWIVDPINAFEKLTYEQQTDLLYDATDMWEKNFGQHDHGWPEVIFENPHFENCLGEIIA